MTDFFQVSGHTALITGAGKRLGRAFAEALASRGANIVVHHGKSSKGAEEVVQFAQDHGVRAIALEADLSKSEQAAALISRSIEAIGEIDMLINNAAIFEPYNAMDTPLEAWERTLAINLTAPFLICQAFAKERESSIGTIVNLLDWRALKPGQDHLPYTIAKAGLAALTKSLAQAFAPQIRVNGLAPGAILPPSGTDELEEALIEGVPAERWGEVDEVVHALLFLLAGPDFVTGEILHLDGGRHLT